MYRAPAAMPVDPGWRPTAERFLDEDTDHALVVWFNPSTGERRYVADGENFATANQSR